MQGFNPFKISWCNIYNLRQQLENNIFFNNQIPYNQLNRIRCKIIMKCNIIVIMMNNKIHPVKIIIIISFFRTLKWLEFPFIRFLFCFNEIHFRYLKIVLYVWTTLNVMNRMWWIFVFWKVECWWIDTGVEYEVLSNTKKKWYCCVECYMRINPYVSLSAITYEFYIRINPYIIRILHTDKSVCNTNFTYGFIRM